MARRRRKARHNPVGRRRRRRSHRRNPRIGRRRRRRNPGEGPFARVDSPAYVLPSTSTGLEGRASAAKSRKKRKRVSKRVRAARRRRRATSRALLKRVRSIRTRARKAPRGSLRRSVLTTQARRLSTLRKVALKGGRIGKSPVAKAMHIKTNPGLAGLVTAAKVLVPQAGVAAVAMVGTALASKKITDMICTEKDATGVVSIRKSLADANGVEKGFVKYIPAGVSVGIGIGGYLLADKFAPKYKGAVALGSLVAAVLQGVAAYTKTASGSAPDGIFMKAKTALGLGDYTTVGARGYAEGGIFREIGRVFNDQGGAYSTQRPRNSFDNRTEWAANGLGVVFPDRGGAYSTQRPRNSLDNATEWAVNGLDDTTEFAPGEGGILNGGMFRGPSTR